MKLFLKSFERRCLFEKRQHPRIFPVFYQQLVFKQSLNGSRCRERTPCAMSHMLMAPPVGAYFLRRGLPRGRSSARGLRSVRSW
ncbi:hypothetical protein FYB92_13250 [Novacetimonas sp. GS1]